MARSKEEKSQFYMQFFYWNLFKVISYSPIYWRTDIKEFAGQLQLKAKNYKNKFRTKFLDVIVVGL